MKKIEDFTKDELLLAAKVIFRAESELRDELQHRFWNGRLMTPDEYNEYIVDYVLKNIERLKQNK